MLNTSMFKERVKTLCKSKGLSQKFVSESTGHGQFVLNDVWLGKRGFEPLRLHHTVSVLMR